ncbi:MAG: mannose-1-phosphate guanylyltransferase [Patescibacteria group bacterium]
MGEFPELKEKVRVVIFCGGYGTRMWPMSRESLPKQFQPILGEKSFFQKTVARVKKGFDPKDIYFSIPKEQVRFVEAQASGVPEGNIIAEPERRDTLGAVAYATAFIHKHYPNSLMAAVWGADHIVKKERKFIELLKHAARICQEKDVLVKIDTKPSYPSTAQGWIKVGKIMGKINGHSVFEFLKHVEKPNLEEAKRMFASRKYYINVGYFVWRTLVMLGFYKKYAPDCYSHIEKMMEVMGTKEEKKVFKKEYHQIEKTSIDYGLFEKLPPGSQLVIPADFGWYDIGTWDLLYEALAIGQRQNIKKGEVEFTDAKGNLVYIPERKIAAIIGVENFVVVDTKDGLLVCQRGRAKDVKRFVNHLKEKGKDKYL